MVILTWTCSLLYDLFSFLSNLESFNVGVEASTIIILSWGTLEFSSSVCKRAWSARRRSEIDIRRLCLSHCICSLMIIFSGSCCCWDLVLTLFSNFETFDIGIESFAIIILPRCRLEFSPRLCKCAWTAR